jgi:hypothetical protein
MKKIVIAFFSILTILFIARSCCILFGSHNLGGKFFLLEGDKLTDKVIVYSTRSFGCSYTGIPVIPADVVNPSIYVESAKSNRKWIIVRSEKIDQTESYWIVNKDFKLNLDNCAEMHCDSIIQSHVIGPLDLVAFNDKLKELKINLKLKKRD